VSLPGGTPARAVDWLLRRAGADGHTAMPRPVLSAALAGFGVPAGEATALLDGLLATGDLAELDGLLQRREEAELERDLAAALRARAAAGSLRVRLGVSGCHHEATPSGAEPMLLVPEAERLDLATAHEAVTGTDPAIPVVLEGAPVGLPPTGPGAVFTDVLAADLVPLGRGTDSHRPATLQKALARLAAGQLPPPHVDPRVLAVQAGADEALAARVVLLVRERVPSGLGIPPRDVTVLASRRGGRLGVDALQALLDGSGARVMLVADAEPGSAAAVVLVLPGEAAGGLHRGVLAHALQVACRHASVVHGLGSLLAQVASRPVPSRVTTLRQRLVA